MMIHTNVPDTNAELAPQLMAVAQSWRRALAQALADQGLSDATALPLTMLSRHGDGKRQNELADMLGLEGTSVVRVLDSLERDGLVRRQEDDRDRRAKRIFLTEEGRALAARSEHVFAQLRSELLEGVGIEDIRATQRLLHAMSAALGVRLGKRRP
ncbi:MAG: MarR family transcriptional regulator [Rhizobiaceae bacterium]|nr:MarR family transcriptional regulator [Rhizobiaceae bacterium]